MVKKVCEHLKSKTTVCIDINTTKYVRIYFKRGDGHFICCVCFLLLFFIHNCLPEVMLACEQCVLMSTLATLMILSAFHPVWFLTDCLTVLGVLCRGHMLWSYVTDSLSTLGHIESNM